MINDENQYFYHNISSTQDNNPYYIVYSPFVHAGGGLYEPATFLGHEKNFPEGELYERGVDLFDTEDEFCEAKEWIIGYVSDVYSGGAKTVYVPSGIGYNENFWYGGLEYRRSQVFDTECEALRETISELGGEMEYLIGKAEFIKEFIGEIEDRISKLKGGEEEFGDGQ